ncbi:MAG: glycosyltransferase family 2 protein [Phycisphaerae bacterium]
MAPTELDHVSLGFDSTTNDPPPRVSVVIASFQRAALLRRCLAALPDAVRAPYEIVVVDGGSSDETHQQVRAHPHLRLFVERRRAGCCRAYDAAFRCARGESIVWLNDDAVPHRGAIDAALRVLDDPANVDAGMVALYHSHQDAWNELHGYDAPPPTASGAPRSARVRYGVLHVRGFAYANFGLLRRRTLEAVGFLDTSYYYCGWDPDLALKIQRELGLRVLAAPAARVWHEEHVDERKAADARGTRLRDNQRLFEKWQLPPKGRFADPRPAYEALLRARGLLEPDVSPTTHAGQARDRSTERGEGAAREPVGPRVLR